jgi:hypothetical protein
VQTRFRRENAGICSVFAVDVPRDVTREKRQKFVVAKVGRKSNRFPMPANWTALPL